MLTAHVQQPFHRHHGDLALSHAVRILVHSVDRPLAGFLIPAAHCVVPTVMDGLRSRACNAGTLSPVKE